MTPFAIAILGGGPGGYVGALHAGVRSARVALVERDRVGGTCVTVGCIPSKALLDSSHAYWLATHGTEHGIHVDNPRFVLAEAVARKQKVVDTLVSGVEQLLKLRKVELIKGEGTVVSPTQLRVKAADGERTIDAMSVIVATGSKVGMPPINGLAEAKPLDNVGALALTELPKRLIVIGGGVIGMELGTFFAEIGNCIGDPRSPKLAHVAFAQAEVAVDTILGEDAVMNYDAVPNVVYTHPELASVGLTEAQAKEKYGDSVKAARFPFAASGRALALGESAGATKIVTAGDGRVVGVHIAGPQAAELIAEATPGMRR